MGATKLMTAAGGGITLDAASTASDKTITVPADNGTLVYANSSGNVGIGTSSPSTKLDVNGNISVTDTILVKKSGNYSNINFYDASSNLLGNLSSDTTSVYLEGRSTYPLRFYTNGAERARIDTSGNLLVGQTTTGTATGSTGVWAGSLNVNPNLNTSSGSANVVWSTPSGLFYRSTSSIRYKENVENASYGLQEVLQLRPVTYNGKSDIDGDKRFGGFIAEEVDAIGLTEFVVYDEENRPDSLGYDRMVSLLTKAIQELKAELDAAKADIAALKGTA